MEGEKEMRREWEYSIKGLEEASKYAMEERLDMIVYNPEVGGIVVGEREEILEEIYYLDRTIVEYIRVDRFSNQAEMDEYIATEIIGG